MICLCPTCGQELKELSLKITPRSGEVIYKGKTTKLTNQEMYIFQSICGSFPKEVTHLAALKAVYGKNIVDKKISTIRVLFHNAKSKLGAIGIHLNSTRGVGYSIDFRKSEPELANYLFKALEAGDV